MTNTPEINIEKEINKIDIRSRKIVFLGYGGVAKCVWNYFDYYFEYDVNKVYIIEKCAQALYGPKIDKIVTSHIIIDSVSSTNFDKLIVEHFDISHHDIIIDLTFCSNTYYFINRCLHLGINYINTSIEDINDTFVGTSIDFQHKSIHDIFEDFKSDKTLGKMGKIRSNVLIECGQNPGLIQHYVLYALNHLNKLYNHTEKDDYSKEALIEAIKTCQIGTILMSEIDNMVMKKDMHPLIHKTNIHKTKQNNTNPNRTRKIKHNNENVQNKIYNTWSVVGLLQECLDKAELIEGGSANKFIKPHISDSMIDINKTSLINREDEGCNVVFLKECGMNSFMKSICPVLTKNGLNQKHHFTTFEGNLIHHGEIFELSRLFGKYSPFMSYVYKVNKYAKKSITTYFKNNKYDEEVDLKIWLMNNCNSFHVYDNIGKISKEKIVGHDTIGCTLFCGASNKIEKIYWCGSILDASDPNVIPDFTPTMVQVAAGVLSGLSYIMEPKNKDKGVLFSTDMDTNYILQKSIPLLGKVFFQEIPSNLFNVNQLHITTKKII